MAGNMKEWFEGFIANGIQFRLDGSEITAFGVSYKIVIKNISNRVICTTGEVYFHFDNDVRKIQQIYAGIERYEDVWTCRPRRIATTLLPAVLFFVFPTWLRVSN